MNKEMTPKQKEFVEQSISFFMDSFFPDCQEEEWDEIIQEVLVLALIELPEGMFTILNYAPMTNDFMCAVRYIEELKEWNIMSFTREHMTVIKNQPLLY